MTTPPTEPDHADDATGDFADPDTLAALVASAPRPLLIGLDIDGVLAPIVAHANDSELLDGVADVIGRLVNRPAVTVAAVSGRALASMRTFGLPAGALLVGSHGMERSGHPMTPLDATETDRLDELHRLTSRAAEEAGDGAWVEEKSASVVLHVREADSARATTALHNLEAAAAHVDGAEQKHGSAVLELFARSASKGTAMRELIAETGAVTSMFVGDDVTDEEAFAALGEAGITVKVGTADTIAGHRLRDPGTVLAWLRALDARLAG